MENGSNEAELDSGVAEQSLQDLPAGSPGAANSIEAAGIHRSRSPSPNQWVGEEVEEEFGDEDLTVEDVVADIPQESQSIALANEALRLQKEELERQQHEREQQRIAQYKHQKVAQYQQAVEEREKLAVENERLQRKLVFYLKAKKNDDKYEDDATRSVTNQDQRYLQSLSQVNELKEDLHKVETHFDRIALDMKIRLEDKEVKAKEIRDSFVKFKREIAEIAENSRTGRKIPKQIIEQFEETELHKDEELEKFRLRNIHLRNQVRKLDGALRQKEELADGLHFIDFEQLKIENQTLNEKIEERNEELLKLRKKTTTTVQVLTHVKEKYSVKKFVDNASKFDFFPNCALFSEHCAVCTGKRHPMYSMSLFITDCLLT
mmetsp:Transcript_17252/g.28550  ORF Transcript_17252/g.28550 Transcript_17252/m.28550 type:complete len:377 (-) Transcript_17252:2661-3791(-)